MTEAERKLWRGVRHRFVEGHRFRRQVPLGPYIVDFCCLQLGLVIEADGSQHAERESDERRDAWLSEQGYRVLRFWNPDIQRSFDTVMETIMRAVAEREAALSAPSPEPLEPASLAVAASRRRHPHPRFEQPATWVTV